MGFILVERDKTAPDASRMREGMRRSMGSRRGGGSDWRDGYRRGYEHGWEDKAAEEEGRVRPPRREEEGYEDDDRPRRYV